jgi:hypothetical protein
MVSPMQIEFEKKLIELGLSYRRNDDDTYSISNHKRGGNHIKVQLIPSLQPVIHIHGSKNGVDVQAIGLFKFKFPNSGNELDFFIFTIPNFIITQADSLIIPTRELWTRLACKNPGYVHSKRIEMVFWLFQDGFVYDATNISAEGEWYFLSKGVNGRMGDNTERDYSLYLNNWRLVTS